MVSTPGVRFLLMLVFALCIAGGTTAQSSRKQADELEERANALFEEDRFAQAFPLFSQLVSLQPANEDFNFKFGACALYAGVSKDKAIKHLQFAVKKNCNDPRVHYYLGKAYHLNYEFAKAIGEYSKYIDKRDPKDKNPLPAETQRQMCRQGSQLLANIRDVVVLEKTSASDEDFFRYYNLEEIGGRVLTVPEELLSKYDVKKGLVSVMHYPGSAIRVYFTSYGKDGKFGKDIYRADLLPDGGFSEPERLPAVLNSDKDEDFAFMHPDGKTFYFASRGHNSMGGYDIFKSSYDPGSDTFSPPVNLDFAVNTPDDDLFYVVDSLGRTAYFASRRSSAQGELHVYKVLVQGIPLNLTFIAGDYFPEAEGIGSNAVIKVYDELTDRPIASLSTQDGDYLLELPKAGKYRMEVSPEGSNITHSGSFDVPSYETSIALAQELRVVKENGLEKLIITNRFEEALDLDLAELAAESLRKRSALDPNADEDKIKEAEALRDRENNTLRDEIEVEDIASLAGYDAATSIDDVAAIMNDKEKETTLLALRADAHAARLYNEASTETREANALLEEAKELMDGADPADEVRYVRVLQEYQKTLLLAEEKSQSASNKLKAAKELNRQQPLLLKKAAEHQEAVVSLNQLLAEKDHQGAVELLKTYRNERGERNSEAEAMLWTIREQRDEAEQGKESILRKLESIAEERNELNTRLKQAKRESDAAKKKSLKAELELEIAGIEDKVSALNEEEQSRRIQLEEVNTTYMNRAAQIQELEFASQSDVNDTFASYDEAKANQLGEDLQKSLGQIDLLKIEDEETLALISNNEQRRDFQIELLPSIQAQAEAQALDLKPIANLKANYQSDRDDMLANAINPNVQERALIDLEIKRIDDNLQFLRSLDITQLDTEERNWKDRELLAAANYRQELTERKGMLSGQQTDNPPVDAAAIVQRDYPQFKGLSQENDRPEDDRVSALIQFNNQLSSDIVQINTQLISADDASEIEALNLQRSEKEAVQKRIREELAINNVQARWEESQKAIIGNDSDYRDRIEAQIKLTEAYLAALPQLLEIEEAPEAKQRILNQEISARNKLEAYKRDLELSINAQSSPESDTAAIVPTLLPEDEGQLLELLGLKGLSGLDQQTRIEEAINERVRYIDAAPEDRERERAQMEIARLERLQMNLVNALAEGSEQEMENTPEASAEEAKSRGEGAAASFEFPETSVDRSGRPEDRLTLQELMNEEAENDALQEAQNTISSINADIELLEEELEKVSARGAINKLDREREQRYKERAAEDITRAELLEASVDSKYELQGRIIRDTWSKLKAQVDDRPRMEQYLAVQQAMASAARDEAKNLRNKAAKERDLIKKGDQFNEALLLEMEALRLQANLQTFMEEQRLLLETTPEKVAANESIADASTDNEKRSETRIEASADFSNDDENSMQSMAEGENEMATEALAGEELVEELRIRYKAPDFPEVAIETEASNRESNDRIKTVQEIENELPEGAGVPADLKRSIEELNALNEEIASLRSIREATVRDFQKSQERIQILENAIASAQSAAEQEGLAEELRVQYRTAEVRYEELMDATERLAEAESKYTEQEELIGSAYAELAIEEKEVPEESDHTGRSETASANALAQNPEEKSGETTPAYTTAEAESTSAGTSSESAPSIAEKTELKARNFLFELPRTLTNSIFELTDAALYSESQPIPVNPTMPEGLVYKVQVGAFRNAIPQEHFNRFAPLAAETLNNGITRYTAGVFVALGTANEAKNGIRSMGYSDAFVVAYFNGKRISLAEARQLANQEATDQLAQNETPIGEGSTLVSEEATGSSGAVARADRADAGEASTNEVAAALGNQESQRADSNRSPAIPSFANDWSTSQGSWFTVQIGVYSKAVRLEDIYNVNQVMAEALSNGVIRYTSGKFDDLVDAERAKAAIRDAGISDAFVTAYVNGKRVPLSSIAPKNTARSAEVQKEGSASRDLSFRLVIGRFSGQVPAATARAMLMLESKHGVTQVRENGITTYYTKSYSTREAAESAVRDFEEQGTSVEGIEEIQ